MYALCIWNCGHVMMTWIENSCCSVFLVLIAILIATCWDLNRWLGFQITQHDGFGHKRKYHRCFLRFERSSRRLSSQRGTEASGGNAVVGKRCNGRSSHWFWEIDHISKLRSGKEFKSSFPIVLRHVLNYSSGYCVVVVSRGEVEILYHFQDFGCWKRLGSMSKLGDSSYFLLIFWSNSNGRLARLSIAAICRFLALFAFSFPSLSYYRSRRLCKSFKPQDSGILIFLVEFMAAFLCCDESLLRYVDVSRMKFNRSAAFLIFNAHFEQTREDKYGSEFKQISRVQEYLFYWGRDFLCWPSEIWKDFRTNGWVPFRLKLTLHTRQKSGASWALGFFPRFCTGFSSTFLLKEYSITKGKSIIRQNQNDWIDDKFFTETWVETPWVFIDPVFHGFYAEFVVNVCVQAVHVKGD